MKKLPRTGHLFVLRDSNIAMPLQDHLIRMLADGRFHSGTSIGGTLGVTRTAVWHAVQSLSALGIEVHAVPGRGYRLAYPLELLNRDQIVGCLRTDAHTLLGDLEVHPDIPSTNSYLLNAAARCSPRSGSVVMAERQRAGRGRRGRRWISPFGANIYCSVGWRFDRAPSAVSGLSLAVGVAVARALTAAGAMEIGLKWPNDIEWRGRKLAGILMEMSGEAEGPCYVVTGIGVNVRMPRAAADEIDQPWVDMATVLGEERISRNGLASELLDQVLPALQEFDSDGLAPFMAEWADLDTCRGKEVSLHTPRGTVVGHACGIDEKGGLLLFHDGRKRRYESGEVSLRRMLDSGGIGAT